MRHKEDFIVASKIIREKGLMDLPEALFSYVDILIDSNKKMNLIGRSTEEKIWTRHIVDSMQLTEFLTEDKIRLLDLGSGAGLPAIVIAILLPHIEITMVEKSPKKSDFLIKCIGKLSLKNITLLNAHTDHIKNQVAAFKPNLITARAFASLKKIIDIAYELNMSSNVRLLLLKGGKSDLEINEARSYYNFDFQSHPSIVSADGNILDISKLRKLNL